MNHKKYLEKYELAKELTNTLFIAQKDINKGDDVTVRYFKQKLILTNTTKQSIAEIPCDDFFIVSDLFEESGIEACGAGATITTKTEFQNFIQCFQDVKHRNKSVENTLKSIYKDLKDDEEFELSIGGGY